MHESLIGTRRHYAGLVDLMPGIEGGADPDRRCSSVLHCRVAHIGTGPIVLRDYAQAAEGLGFDYLLVGDHVLGNNPTATPLHSARADSV